MSAFWTLSALHRGEHLAAAIPSTAGGHLAWVGVYPLSLDRPSTQQFLKARGEWRQSDSPAYRIRVFEVREEAIAAGECISEPDLKNRADIVAYGDDALVAELTSFGVKIEDLVLPYAADYPI